MARKKQRAQRINWWILILVILLALLLIFSRSRRAARRVGKPAFSAVLVKNQQPDALNLIPAPEMIQNPALEISPSLLLGKTDPASDPLFVAIETAFASRGGMYLHHQAMEAFAAMHEAAAEEGVSLVILSAMRTFDHQKRIWNGKWNGNTLLHGSILGTDIQDPGERAREILRFSAMPGTSRHHWGTDVDLNSLQNSYFLSGEGKKVYQWLQANAWQFGFFQPYSSVGDGRQGGYEEEKWHWSFYPVAARYLEAYGQMISYDDIRGFDGWETARQLDVIQNYVMQVKHPE